MQQHKGMGAPHGKNPHGGNPHGANPHGANPHGKTAVTPFTGTNRRSSMIKHLAIPALMVAALCLTTTPAWSDKGHKGKDENATSPTW